LGVASRVYQQQTRHKASARRELMLKKNVLRNGDVILSKKENVFPSGSAF